MFIYPLDDHEHLAGPTASWRDGCRSRYANQTHKCYFLDTGCLYTSDYIPSPLRLDDMLLATRLFFSFLFFLCVCLCVCAYIPICVTSYDCHHCCNWCFSVCCSYNRRAGALNYYDPLSIVPVVVVSPIIWSLVLLLMTAVVVVPGVSLWRAVRVLCLPTAVPTAFAGCSWKGF